ncbi:MAG: TonB-dependent receptor plug domain-containing protein [Tannerella sp.]|jgi:hypothetical protein|nr:TonB-dependent receptor plug domain-containing protein [Tannerella sp.]
MKFFILLLCILPFASFGQRTASGQITDAEDKTPVQGVTVFLSNTSVADMTDADGRYRLEIPGEGSYQLTVSHVGYQAVYKDIEAGTASFVFDVALQPREMDEVVIAKKIKFRQRDINLFWQTVLGEKPTERRIWVQNPEAVYYYYNADTRKLTVTCREPLQIFNYELGYHIQYILKNFTHDYGTDVTEFSQQFFFSELEPENLKQKNEWENRRREVYRISAEKFYKSLYNNSMTEDGFVLADLRKSVEINKSYEITVLDPAVLLSPAAPDGSRTLNFAGRQILLICYGRPVTEMDLQHLNTLDVRDIIKNQRLMIDMLQGESIRIYPDGTYADLLEVLPVNLLSTIMSLNRRLPTEYLPEALSIAMSEMEKEKTAVLDSVSQRIATQLYEYPQEKIHLHTDRDVYVPGEKIWFKAYLVDAATHQRSDISRYIFVELVSPDDSLVNRVMIRPENGMFFGYLPITERVPDGYYTLRSYTRYMENSGEDYFFRKNIRIGNIGNLLSLVDTINNERNDMILNDFDVSFFPEGGNLVEGVLSRVALKALRSDGTTESISGKIVDENGIVITDVQTFYAGMGVFSITPERGKKYSLQCSNTANCEKRFELPQANARAYALTAIQDDETISVGILKNPLSPDIPGYLMAHCRGKIIYFDVLNSDDRAVDLITDDLPAGIIHLILFDRQLNPLSERLVFNKNDKDMAQAEWNTDKASYEQREHVLVTLSLTGLQENLQEGDLSVAVTDDRDLTADASATVASTLLLSSELKGNIENPAWYLNENPDAQRALDLLMMTHGWRRYDMPAVAGGKLENPSIAPQTGQEISGTVKRSGLFGRSSALVNSEVSILSQQGNFAIVSTDLDGRFKYRDIEFPDSTMFFIQSLSDRGANRTEIVLDGELFPPPVHVPILETLRATSLQDEDAFIGKAEQRAKYDEDMWSINLSEVEVTARRMASREEPRLKYELNKGSDATVRREAIAKVRYTHIADYLSTVPGVRVSTDPLDPRARRINIRGASSYSLSTEPLIIIDGVAVSGMGAGEDPLASMPVEMVESIDVFSGGSASAFGARGANGVISITTVRGFSDSDRLTGTTTNNLVYSPLGYQKPIEFYAPKYDSPDAKNSTIPDFRTTIFWKPDIIFNGEEEVSFDFYTADFPTTYSVVIEGLTADGKIIRQVEKIEVK